MNVEIQEHGSSSFGNVHRWEDVDAALLPKLIELLGDQYSTMIVDGPPPWLESEEDEDIVEPRQH
jgi:hypothetical protein